MKVNREIMCRSLDKKLIALKNIVPFDLPEQGWIRTIREALGMTTSQLAKRLKISQARIVHIEKNENNLKISTLNKIAKALNCAFVYYIIPNDNIKNIVSRQAHIKASNIIGNVNKNMSLENQLSDSKEILEDLTKDLLNKNISRIWDED
ncbi:MAG: mobile mystery protein A [Endomicrobium sp.]|jgi:predicted DNA-binding mobile mystery protein A|nr:mobile mystery protein A [Endomicrobium sp.]